MERRTPVRLDDSSADGERRAELEFGAPDHGKDESRTLRSAFCSGSRPVNRPATQDRLKQTVVEVVRVRVNRVWPLARVAESGANQRIQEISARHEFSKNAESGGVVLLQIGEDLRGRVGLRLRYA